MPDRRVCAGPKLPVVQDCGDASVEVNISAAVVLSAESNGAAKAENQRPLPQLAVTAIPTLTIKTRSTIVNRVDPWLLFILIFSP